MWEKLLAFLQGKPSATAADLEAEFGKKTEDEKKDAIDFSNLPKDTQGLERAIKQLLDVNAAQTEQNKSLIAALAEEKKARESALKTTQDQQEADRLKAREAWIKKHTEEGRIPALNEEEKKNWEKQYDLDSTLAEFSISKIQGKKSADDKNTDKKTETPSTTAVDFRSLNKQAEAELQSAIK
jgi:hypothetical protein